MNDAERNDDVLREVNEALKQEPRLLGRDPAMFNDLQPGAREHGRVTVAIAFS